MGDVPRSFRWAMEIVARWWNLEGHTAVVGGPSVGPPVADWALFRRLSGLDQ